MSKLLHFLRKNKSEFIFLNLMFCLIYGLEAVMHPILIKSIFDEGVMKSNYRMFIYLVFAYLILGFLINIIDFKLSLWNKKFSNRIFKLNALVMLRAYYQKQYNFIIEKKEGYFINRIYNDVSEGIIPYLNIFTSLVITFTRVIAFVIVLSIISWKTTLLLLIMSPIIAYISKRIGYKIKNVTSKERESQGLFLEVLSKSLSAFRVIKSFSFVPHVVEKNETKLDDYITNIYNNFKYIKMYKTTNSLIMNISDFATIFIGSILVLKGELSFGAYLAFINVFWRAMSGIMGIFKPFAELQRLNVIIDRLYDFETKINTTNHRLRANSNQVALRNVSFSYNDTCVLQNLNLFINPGERVLIEGANGTGKTTLLHVLSGLLDPNSGSLELPSKISVVTLPIIFPPLSVWEICDNMGMLKTFGLEHLKDKMANDLSMGEKQKLAISVACAYDANLYLFDEPVANIDKYSQSKIMDIIDKNTKGKTVVTIMHKGDEYYQHYDKVVVLDNKTSNV